MAMQSSLQDSQSSLIFFNLTTFSKNGFQLYFIIYFILLIKSLDYGLVD